MYSDQQAQRDEAQARRNALEAQLGINLASLFQPEPSDRRCAAFEGRIVGFFGLVETTEQPDHNSVVLRLGPDGSSYERVFLAAPKVGAA